MLLHRIYRLISLVTGIAFFVFCIGFIYFYYQEKPEQNIVLESLPSVNQQTKLLVFAPHCDDETLGCAGIIHDVIQAGGQVLVVIMTNGDGFTFSTEEQFHRVFPTKIDYIHSGYVRQQESLHALQCLGVPANQVLFLGYPDRGLNSIWNDYWDIDTPFTSHFTASNHSPYSNSYQVNAPYSGQAIFNNITKTLKEFQPNFILLPHPHDEHHDHSATWAFAISTVAQFSNRGIALPKIFTYLIHRGDFPIPHGYKPELSLLPPRPLSNLPHWYSNKLNPDAKNLKEQSIKEYVSQIKIPIMSNLLYSFIRTNELFEAVHIPVIKPAPLDLELTALDVWLNQEPILINPIGVNPLGALERKARVTSVYSFIQAHTLWLRFHIPDLSVKKNHYHVNLIQFSLQESQFQREKRAINFSTLDTDLPQNDISRSSDDVILKLPFNQQNTPDLLFIQITTTDKLGATIDQTVWQPLFTREMVTDT
ncbi:LmbE family N-acetylglucosaminyl deacetylase [Sporomusaceae bacterium BoRhaA]|uniref:PIG-L deacetylase family protein n=1 Tax=Pelorhabdus rhamnosifermentans TaxID=2772457 RepID=UPI001C0627BB|nr:PIG-L family deacetylase [Pelorhabdus rhamnosifermentans]MBU2699950.1 LmbE family N-acetylglucosaminyl deacetylase [Pelorhabdus rhamnosifermentans]